MPSSTPKRGSTARETVRLGVAGAGWWSTTAHLPAAAGDPRIELVAVADPHAEAVEAARRRFGIARCYESAAELLAGEEIDALVVATPHATHHAIARAALDAGVHVLVEKPIALTTEDAIDLHRRAQARGLTLAAGYTYHFAPGARLARAALCELGAIELVSILFTSSLAQFLHLDADPADAADGPRATTYADAALAGGGQGQTQVTHAVEMALWMTRRLPRRVSALMRAVDSPLDEIDVISVELDDGALMSVASTGRQPVGGPTPQELRYCGTRGTLLQDLVRGSCELHAGGRRRVFRSPEDGAYPLGGPLADFVDAIQGGRSCASGWSAVAAVALLEAAYASARAMGQPIEIPLDDLPAPDRQAAR